MPTTHSRTSAYISYNMVGLYTNSTSKAQRILITDLLFQADNAYYSSDMGNITIYIIKRADNINSGFVSTIFQGYMQYPYSLWANWSSSNGAGSALTITGNTSPTVGHMAHQLTTYSAVPYSTSNHFGYGGIGFAQQGQHGAYGLGQCILYPGDTIRAGCQKYGTVYLDFLIMTE